MSDKTLGQVAYESWEEVSRIAFDMNTDDVETDWVSVPELCKSWYEKMARDVLNYVNSNEQSYTDLQAEIKRLREVYRRGCDCSTDAACKFAMERDEARAEAIQLRIELQRLNEGLAALYQKIGHVSVEEGDSQAVIVAMDGCYELTSDDEEI